MRLPPILLLGLLALPAQAQRGRLQEGLEITSSDIERLSPARVVLDRRKDLRLDSPRIAKLDSLRKAFDDSAKRIAADVKKHQRAITEPPPLLRRPPEGRPETLKDSLERVKLDSTNRVKNDAYIEKVLAGRRDLASALLALKDLFDTSLAATIAALDGSQHTAAALSLDRASEEFTRHLRLANIR